MIYIMLHNNYIVDIKKVLLLTNPS
jgi:hypothetical protein